MKETNAQRKERIKRAKARSTCPSGKIQYISLREASKVLLKMWREGNLRCERAYACEDCGQWHLTSMEITRRRRR